MKHIFFSLLALFLVPFFASAEEIRSFTSDVNLNTDGSFVVTENIEYDFKNEERHGIFRYIEKKHPQKATSIWKERYIDIELQEVSIDGVPVAYEITNSKDQLEVKIGDPYSTISGVHHYTISYEVDGGYSYFDDGSAEVYWNVTGNGWEVPIASVRAGVQADFLEEDSACYIGSAGASTPCTAIEKQTNGSILFSAHDLYAGSGLTIAQQVDGAEVKHVILERYRVTLILFLVLPVIALAFVIWTYRYRTKYKTGNPIIAQYEPYENFKPMYSGMLFDGRLDPHDITAGIVYLAEQGFLKIKKIEKKVLFVFEVDDYEITLLRSMEEIESPYLRDVLELILPSSAQVNSTVALSELREDISKQRHNALQLQKLRSDLKKDMRRQGFYQVNEFFVQFLISGAAFVVVIFLLGSFLSLDLLIIFFIAMILGSVLFFVLYERRTRKGYEALDHLKGFKLFLSVTDEERFKFHNAPQKSPEQFMVYLPYAIAFGVEKQWAEVFKDITMSNPDWYDGGSVGSFSAVNLTSSLGAFSSSFTTSSGSSGGSGGGGSSGGGGGGGGGGSW